MGTSDRTMGPLDRTIVPPMKEKKGEACALACSTNFKKRASPRHAPSLTRKLLHSKTISKHNNFLDRVALPPSRPFKFWKTRNAGRY